MPSADITPVSPAKLPEHLQRIEEEVYELPPQQVADKSVREYRAFERSGWSAAWCLLRVKEERLYSESKFGAWVDAQGMSKVNVSRLIGAAIAVRAMPEEYRAPAMRTPPGVVYDAGVKKLVESDPEEAGRLASAGLTRSELKRAVAVRLPKDQHMETQRVRNFLLPCSEPDYYKLQLAYHGTRILMPEPHPGGPVVADRMLANVLDYTELLAQLEPIRERFPLEDIAAGKCVCIECGASNGNGLESHHAVPRSVKGKDEHGTYSGKDGPQVWLCREHHQVVTENIDGTWRDWVERWLARKDLRWFREEMEAWLGPRTLAEVGR